MSEFTYLQQYAYSVMKLGFNTFLTGDAGTGKSYIIREFIEYSRQNRKNVMVLAPTGIAAGNVGGVTIHHQFGIPVTISIAGRRDIKLKTDELEYTDIVIIEEISTCRIDIFECVSKLILDANTLRRRYGRKPIQLIVVGDFFQLPPVMTNKDKLYLDRYYNKDIGLGFAFQSDYWQIFNFKNIVLMEIIRQENKEFIEYLNKVRIGDKSCLDELYIKASKEPIDNAVTLCGINQNVSEINKKELDKIESELIEIDALITKEDEYANINLNHNASVAEIKLNIKIGARVMTLINDKDGAYYNGSFGTVTNINDNIITVRLDNGNIVNIERYEWTLNRYEIEQRDYGEVLIEKEIGTISQFPLKLAYAITIHKSQGQTYESVNLNPYCWDCGQLYVALSRVRKLENIYINYEIDQRYLVVSLNVIDFYNKMVANANKNITQDEVDKLNNYEINSEKISSETKNDMLSIMNKLKLI